MNTPPLVTICIPYAGYHSKLVERAVDSAYRQTVPCVVKIREDGYEYGAGDNRNALLSSVKTPFVVFLDADDTLEPRFVEHCLRVVRPGTYVYTDWYEDRTYNRAPICDAWIHQGHKGVRMHLVTTLLVTEYARLVKGFDPALPGAEDTDFYLKLRAIGVCPVHVKKPLLHYSGDGQRSEKWKVHPDRIAILSQMFDIYGGQIVSCGCNATGTQGTEGEKQPGDVIAETLYEPAREFGYPDEAGQRRYYKRQTHKGAKLWVAPRDIRHFPGKWRLVDDPERIAPDIDKVASLALEGLEAEAV